MCRLLVKCAVQSSADDGDCDDGGGKGQKSKVRIHYAITLIRISD